jgi:hypothetical protein
MTGFVSVSNSNNVLERTVEKPTSVGQLMGATAWLWLTVPFLAVFAGLPFGSNGP